MQCHAARSVSGHRLGHGYDVLYDTYPGGRAPNHRNSEVASHSHTQYTMHAEVCPHDSTWFDEGSLTVGEIDRYEDTQFEEALKALWI